MRVKTGVVRRQSHKRVLKLAKGFWMTRHKRFKVANEAVMHAGQYAYHGRRLRKRDLRRTWITRLSAALIPHEFNYSRFIKALKDKKIILNRKVLSEIAVNDLDTFNSIVDSIK
jgi:large subunit ribosomal protein L20